MKQDLDQLKSLNREEILQIPLNTHGDYEMLDLAEYFVEEKGDEDRQMAVFELILRSPLNDEMVAYDELYMDLANYYQRKENYPAMLYWSTAQVGYYAQNESSILNLLNSWRDLAEAYLHAGEINSGLKIFTRLIARDPGNIWNYNTLGMTLPRIGLNSLAIEVLDRGLALVAKKDPENLRKQLQDMQQEARANLANGQDQTEQAAPDTLQALRAALSLPPSLTTTEEESLPHLAPLDQLITLDRQGDPKLEKEILDQGKALIPELIHLGLDEDLMQDTLGPWHAARLLNQLRAGPAPELESLANWLNRTETEDWTPWLSAKKFGKIGGYSIAELEAFTRDPQNGEVIRVAAAEELTERAIHRPADRLKTVDLLRDLLNRPNADQAVEETFTAFLISNAVDLEAKELLPDIRRAFEEDRVDQHVLDETFVNEKFGLPTKPRPPRRNDGLYLRLNCTACGRTREHFTRFVILDQTTFESKEESKHPTYIIDREFVCPKCGAVEQYQLESFELMKLMQVTPGNIVSILSNQESAKPPKPNEHVYMVRGAAFGRQMNPLDIVDEYRRRIALDPQNGELYMRLGNTLRFIGRFKQSLEVYRKAVELAPSTPDVLFTVATAEHDYGDPAAAKRLYEQCVAQGKGIRENIGEGLDENAILAMQGLRALNKGEMSDWEYQLKNADGRALEPPKRQIAVQAAKKDKRAKRHKKS